jgi:hypothetical protein
MSEQKEYNELYEADWFVGYTEFSCTYSNPSLEQLNLLRMEYGLPPYKREQWEG